MHCGAELLHRRSCGQPSDYSFFLLPSGPTPQVTKTAFRILHTLYNLGPAPEPNITILWHDMMPEAFKKWVARPPLCTLRLLQTSCPCACYGCC